MQTLVYGNYNKFISATDTTRKVQGKMQKVSCWEKFKFCTAFTALNVRYKCCAHESSNLMKYLNDVLVPLDKSLFKRWAICP
jgi:hypothetical protein